MSAGRKASYREGLFGLVLGALSFWALLSLIDETSGHLERLFGETQAEAPLRSSAPRPKLAPVTSSIPKIAPAYGHDAAMREQAEAVVDYRVTASLDPHSHKVRGRGEILFRNRSRAPVSELWFHLYLNAFKSDKTLFFQGPSLATRGRGALVDPGFIEVHRLVAKDFGDENLWAKAAPHSPESRHDQTNIRVPLPAPLAPGASIRLEISFTAKLPGIVARTGHRDGFHMVAQWFPKVARLEDDGSFAHFAFYGLSEFYADFGNYDITIDVPESFIVGATGPRIESHREGGRLRVRHVQSDVHDFAWVAWDGFREREVEAEGTTIRCLYPPGYESLADRQIETAIFGLRRFGEAFGRYPYPVLTLVHPPSFIPEAGGMEYPTLMTTGGSRLSPRPLRGIEHLTLHEFGHQYFYGLVATNEHKWPFLDEGLNSYAESVFLDERFGPGSIIDFFGLRLGIGELHRTVAILRGHRAPLAQPAKDFSHAADYAALVYSRTATVLQTFARVYGEEKLMRALGLYARRYRFEHPGPEEFIAAIRDVLGEEAEQSLRVALLERGFVDYLVEGASSEPVSGEGGEPIWRGLARIRRHGNLSFPVEIDLLAEDGTSSRTLWDGRESTLEIPYLGQSPLVAVHIDPEAKVFLDENLFNNRFRIGKRPSAPRAFERLSYGLATLLQASMP